MTLKINWKRNMRYSWKIINRWSIILRCLRNGLRFKSNKLNKYYCNCLLKKDKNYRHNSSLKISTRTSSKHLLLSTKRSLKGTTQESIFYSRKRTILSNSSIFVSMKNNNSHKLNQNFKPNLKNYKFSPTKKKRG